MAKKKKSFLLHIDSLDILDDLDNDQVASLFRAIKSYQNGDHIELEGIAKIVFSPFKNQFIRDDEKYKDTCEKRAVAGSAGGSVYKKDPGIDNKGELQLYVIKLYSEDEEFIKIGTTTSKINRRFSGPKNMPYNYEVLYQIIDGVNSAALEPYFQNALSDYSYSPKIKFPGHMECFTKEAINKLLENERFAQANQSKPRQTKAKLADKKNKTKSDSDSDSKSNNKEIYQQIADAFNSNFPELANVIKVSQKRKAHINACIKEFKGQHDLEDLEVWNNLFDYIGKSDFLMGRSSDWACDFDFLINKNNLLKVIEGKYDNNNGQS